jgi:hypothetical protein
MYKRYRLNQATIAMFEDDGCHVAHHVPAGSILMVDGALDGNKLMDVLWADKKVFMFTQDLRTRAVLEPGSSE